MIFCCWYFDTGSYSDVERQVNVQVWDNFLALATSAIPCATTFLDSSQHRVLKCQADTAVGSPKGTKLYFSVYDSVDNWSLARELAHGLHCFKGQLQRKHLSWSATVSFIFQAEGASFMITWYQKFYDRFHHCQACVFLILLVHMCIFVPLTVLGNKECQCSMCLSSYDRRAEEVTNRASRDKQSY